MPLNLIGQNKSTISPLGGGQIWFCQVNQDGTPLSSPDTFHQFPILKDSELDDEAPFTEYPAEDGSVYVATAQRKVTLNLTTYQRDTGTLTFAPTDTAGNYYAVLKQVSSTLINGVYQYLFAPLCQIEQSVKYKTLGNEIGVKVWVNPFPPISPAPDGPAPRASKARRSALPRPPLPSIKDSTTRGTRPRRKIADVLSFMHPVEYLAAIFKQGRLHFIPYDYAWNFP